MEKKEANSPFFQKRKKKGQESEETNKEGQRKEKLSFSCDF